MYHLRTTGNNEKYPMGREQGEHQFLGFFGLRKESIDIISRWRRVFTKIAISLILTFSFIYLANIEISTLLGAKIRRNERTFDFSREGTTIYDKISNLISSQRALNVLVKLVQTYFISLFSLISTYVVICNVMCIYVEKEIILMQDWMKLFISLLWSFAFVSAYHYITLSIFIIWASLYGHGDIGMTILYLMFGIYLSGLVCISVIWVFAFVVTMSEGTYGIQAMIKSTALITGSKRGVYIAILLCLHICFLMCLYIGSGMILCLFWEFVVLDGRIGIGWKIGCGALTIFFLSLLFIFSHMVQTALSDRLDAYLQEYNSSHIKDGDMERMVV